jgi:hypothetical protein
MADETTTTDGKLSVGDLCRMFEESEDSTWAARKESERDRDYVDNKQLTDEELNTLKKRGQPPVIDNRIKTKIDYLVGLEKQQGVMPKAMPRTPVHESDADACTESLRYVAEEQDFASKRSAVWRNLLVEGSGGIAVSVEQAVDYQGRPGIDIKLKKIAWDRMFADPHSSELDYEDAGYKGLVTWMDYDDAIALYPDGKDALDTTLDNAPSDTYDDKPKYSLWADKKRKRVRICQIWVKRDNQWYFAEFTKGGILKAGPSPHKTDRGESDDELVFQSAYVDRDNNRYGLVREMITLQDEINKRRSKGLHLLNTSQVIYEDGAVEDINEFHRQSVRPDGKMKVAPGALEQKRVQFNTREDLATAHFQLLQEAKNAIDLKGPNATEMGDKTQGANAASGKAIIASQQGGMIQIGDLMDGLRHLDKRVFRKIWYRVRQYWTAEKWIRVTDDEQNIKWLGVNVDPRQVQMLAMQNPQAAQKIAGAVGNLAELDCDIIIDDAPDSLTPQLEQFQALVELKKFDQQNELPFRAIVGAMPNLKDKQAFLKQMDQAQQGRAQQQQVASQLQLKDATSKIDKTQSETMLNVARAQELGQLEQQQPGKFELPPELQIAKAASDISAQQATTDHKRTLTALAPIQAAHDINMDRVNFVQGAREAQANREQKAKQPVRAA